MEDLSQVKYDYAILPISLAGGLTNTCFEIAGNSIQYLSGASTIQIRLNDPTKDLIPITAKQYIEAKFHRIYITAMAAAETITLLISRNTDVILGGPGLTAVDSISKIAGTPLSGRDWSGDFANLPDLKTYLGNLLHGDEGTQVAKYNTAVNSTTIVHTVTAGKVFLLEGYDITIFNGAAAGGGFLLVRNDLDVNQYTISRNYFAAALSDNRIRDFTKPLRIPAGWDICLISDNASISVYGFIHGREVAA